MDSNEETATRQVFVVQKPAKNSCLAAILSFFWYGLGQIGKNIAFIVLYFISWGLIWILIDFLTTPDIWVKQEEGILGMIGLVATPVLWVWGHGRRL